MQEAFVLSALFEGVCTFKLFHMKDADLYVTEGNQHRHIHRDSSSRRNFSSNIKITKIYKDQNHADVPIKIPMGEELS